MTANTEEFAPSARARVATASATNPLRACRERAGGLQVLHQRVHGRLRPRRLRTGPGARLLNFPRRSFERVDVSGREKRWRGRRRAPTPRGWRTAGRGGRAHHEGHVHVGQLAEAEAGSVRRLGPTGTRATPRPSRTAARTATMLPISRGTPAGRRGCGAPPPWPRGTRSRARSGARGTEARSRRGSGAAGQRVRAGKEQRHPLPEAGMEGETERGGRRGADREGELPVRDLPGEGARSRRPRAGAGAAGESGRSPRGRA
jgi:hypothetical protein